MHGGVGESYKARSTLLHIRHAKFRNVKLLSAKMTSHLQLHIKQCNLKYLYLYYQIRLCFPVYCTDDKIEYTRKLGTDPALSCATLVKSLKCQTVKQCPLEDQ